MVFGIIGYGRFGRLWSKALLPFGEVKVYDKNLSAPAEGKGIKITSLSEVVQTDILFILVPISEFKNCCLAVKDFLNLSTLVVDCCSVKIYPATIMQSVFLTEQPIFATHPLFGPDSVQKTGGLAGHKIVVCPIQPETNAQKKLYNIFSQMGLHTLITTPDDHDKQMANSQGLVHFIGRGLAALELRKQELATLDFQALLNINTMVVHDTWQLFLDMQSYNPYMKEIRQKFINQLIKLNHEIDHKT